MPNDTLRNPVAKIWELYGSTAHPGLLLSRYLDSHKTDGDTPKLELCKKAISAATHVLPIYQPAFDRWEKSVPADAMRFKLKVSEHQRLIIGLGSSGVLETGITLHHTYGVPYLPATAIKGVASHYAHTFLGKTNSAFKKTPEKVGEFAELLFGSTDAGGLVQFSDGWIDPQSVRTGCLHLDVMTPHHGDYYMAAEDDVLNAPTDFDDPVPVPFLSVSTATFHVALSIRHSEQLTADESKRWLELAKEIVVTAVAELGIGGKTGSGYGRLECAD